MSLKSFIQQKTEIVKYSFTSIHWFLPNTVEFIILTKRCEDGFLTRFKFSEVNLNFHAAYAQTRHPHSLTTNYHNPLGCLSNIYIFHC